MINQDTILHQTMVPHTAFHLSKEIPKGKYRIQVSDLLTGVTNADTLFIRDPFSDEHIYIEYQYLSAIEAIGKNMNKYGHNYPMLAKEELTQPVERGFELNFHHTDFFNYLWE